MCGRGGQTANQQEKQTKVRLQIYTIIYDYLSSVYPLLLSLGSESKESSFVYSVYGRIYIIQSDFQSLQKD